MNKSYYHKGFKSQITGINTLNVNKSNKCACENCKRFN